MTIKDHLITGEAFNIDYNTQLDCYQTRVLDKSDFDRYYAFDNYQSHNQDSDGWFNKIYKISQQYNLWYKYREIKKLKTKDKTILDYGCGVGDFLKKMRLEKWEAQGYEPNVNAKEILKKKGIITINGIDSVEKNSVDVITLWHVLEHIENPLEIIKELKDKLKENGFLIIAVPNFNAYDAKYYKTFWAAYDVPRHLYHFQKKSLQIIAEKLNLTLTKQKPLWLDAIYISILSEKNKKGGVMLLGIIIGLISNFKAIFTKEPSSIIYFLKKTI